MFHANGWTFVWIVTARGATHVCLRKVEPHLIFALMVREWISMVCAAPTVLIAIANAPPELRAGAPRKVRLLTAGAPPAAVTIERIESELGWELTHVYGLTETAPFITVCEELPEHAGLAAKERAAIKARQGVELVTSGELRVIDERGDDVPRDGRTTGEIVVRGHVVMQRLLQRSGGDGARLPWRLGPLGRCGRGTSGRLRGDPRSAEGCNHQGRREYLFRGSGGGTAARILS